MQANRALRLQRVTNRALRRSQGLSSRSFCVISQSNGPLTSLNLAKPQTWPLDKRWQQQRSASAAAATAAKVYVSSAELDGN
jgi:hypothetical protein